MFGGLSLEISPQNDNLLFQISRTIYCTNSDHNFKRLLLHIYYSNACHSCYICSGQLLSVPSVDVCWD